MMLMLLCEWNVFFFLVYVTKDFVEEPIVDLYSDAKQSLADIRLAIWCKSCLLVIKIQIYFNHPGS